MNDAESVADIGTLANRSAFERDILWVLSNDGGQKGVDIRLSLEEYYEKPVNHGQLYPNLDNLVEDGFLEKGEIDGRTNSYALTEAGRRTLTSRQTWESGSSEETEEGESTAHGCGGGMA